MAEPSLTWTLMVPKGALRVVLAPILAFTTSWVNQSLQITRPLPGNIPRGIYQTWYFSLGVDKCSPSTVVTLGSSTGVTNKSLPMRYCLSTENSSGSLGNSKNNALTGGAPKEDELANSVYYKNHVNVCHQIKRYSINLPSTVRVRNVQQSRYERPRLHYPTCMALETLHPFGCGSGRKARRQRVATSDCITLHLCFP